MCPNYFNANCILELENESGADGLDNGWCSALFAVFHIVEIHVLKLVDVSDRSASDNFWNGITQELFANNEHSRCSGSANKFVGRKENRVLVRRWVCIASWVHLNIHIGGCSRKIPES